MAPASAGRYAARSPRARLQPAQAHADPRIMAGSKSPGELCQAGGGVQAPGTEDGDVAGGAKGHGMDPTQPSGLLREKEMLGPFAGQGLMFSPRAPGRVRRKPGRERSPEGRPKTQAGTDSKIWTWEYSPRSSPFFEAVSNGGTFRASRRYAQQPIQNISERCRRPVMIHRSRLCLGDAQSILRNPRQGPAPEAAAAARGTKEYPRPEMRCRRGRRRPNPLIQARRRTEGCFTRPGGGALPEHI